MPRTLIYAQCHLKAEEQGRLLGVAIELNQRLNPSWDFLLIDNASPLDPVDILSGCAFGEKLLDDYLPTELHQGIVNVWRFCDAIGHFSPKFTHEMPTPKDGPGRAMMKGLEIARASGYDRVVYAESDTLFAKPFEEGFAQMKRPTACLPRTKWGYLDWQAWWIADLPWLVDQHKFIEKYDWPNQTGTPEGERVYETILSGYLDVLPWRGGRGDGWIRPDGSWQPSWITGHNMRTLFPEGIDYLTHCDTDAYKEFLRMNGHDDLVERL